MSERTVALAVTVTAPDAFTAADLQDVLRFHLGLGELNSVEVDLSAVTIRDARVAGLDGSALHLLTGEHPGPGGGMLLVHVWPDGTGEVAYRDEDRSSTRWGAPSRLEPAP